jgi:hypothetical protein
MNAPSARLAPKNHLVGGNPIRPMTTIITAKRKSSLTGNRPITKIESAQNLMPQMEEGRAPTEPLSGPANAMERSRVRKLDATTVNVVAKSRDEMLTNIRTPNGTTRDEVVLQIIGQVASNLVRPSLKSMVAGLPGVCWRATTRVRLR